MAMITWQPGPTKGVEIGHIGKIKAFVIHHKHAKNPDAVRLFVSLPEYSYVEDQQIDNLDGAKKYAEDIAKEFHKKWMAATKPTQPKTKRK